jgi:hypothetical protein
MMSFTGVGMSGTADNAKLYTEAIKAVDGLCTSCATANSPSGNYYMVGLPVRHLLQLLELLTSFTCARVSPVHSAERGRLSQFQLINSANKLEVPATLTQASAACSGLCRGPPM